MGNEPDIAPRITVRSVRGIGHDLFTAAFGPPTIATPDMIRGLLTEACAAEGQRFAPCFLFGKFTNVVDAWQPCTREDYRNVARLGRAAPASAPGSARGVCRRSSPASAQALAWWRRGTSSPGPPCSPAWANTMPARRHSTGAVSDEA